LFCFEEGEARASEANERLDDRGRKKTHSLLLFSEKKTSSHYHRNQDRAPTLDDMPKLRWTTRVINESMRLYPQPPVLIRRAAVDTKLVSFPLFFFQKMLGEGVVFKDTLPALLPRIVWDFLRLFFFLLFFFFLLRERNKRQQKEETGKTHSRFAPLPGRKKPKPSKTGGLRHPCRLRPLPERLESPPRPGKVERRRRIHPGAVWPRRRRRCCEGGGGMPSERQPPVAFCRLRFRFVSLFFFVRRPERDHRVFFVPAFRRGQAQVHRGPVCAFRERDGSGDLCAEGKFMKFCFWRLFERQRRFGKGIKRKNSPLFA
jgi:hypothetical protein